ncbi:MAG: GNAT family N-acetyltransferase [Anaerolineales bacterium]|jgi:ribosomal protein S18 acetylase RimI-like enzyme|nr:GNAT family N-acetyltransferase [Anaerolineales bacterium]
MSELQIRNTISTDLARLGKIDHTIQSEYVWQLDLRREPGQVDAIFREVRLPRSVQIDHPRPAAELSDIWHTSPMLTAMLKNEAIGYIRFSDQMIPHGVWITDVVVARDLRRNGIARKLIAAAQAWGAQKGLRRTIIETQSKNYPAIRMFYKLGFEFCGYNDIYYSTRDIALFFSRPI